MDNSMLEAALRYAKRGWPVFPVQATKKEPWAKSRAYLDATTDLAQIETWWGEFPESNVAIATGEPGPDILDFDVKHGAPGGESYNRLRAAGKLAGAFAIVSTPSGGRHVYFHGTPQRRSVNAALGLDFLSQGGYALAPPSHIIDYDVAGEVTNAGYYEKIQARPETGVMLSWQEIKDFLVPPRSPRIPGASDATSSARIAGAIRAMSESQHGEHNHMLFWSASRLADNDATEADWDELARVAEGTGHARSRVERTIASARRR